MRPWSSLAGTCALLAGAALTASAGDERSAPAPIAVRVVACDGTPIEGARVEASEPAAAVAFGRFPRDPATVEQWEAATRRPDVVAAATAGADGTAPIGGLRAGLWSFVATRSGWAAARVDVSIGDDAGTRAATIVLPHGHALTGTVRDTLGRPVAGATAIATFGPIVRATTAADGAYRLDDLPADDVDLWIAPPGALAAPCDTLDLRTLTKFDVELPIVASPVMGTVLDAATKKPIAGARVRISTPRFDDDRPKAAAEGFTDERGRYSIAAFRSVRVGSFLVEKPGYVTFDVFDGPEARIGDARLVPAARVVGTERGPDRPIAGAHVHATAGRPEDWKYPPPGWQRRECDVVTDADGRYVVDRLPPGPIRLEVAADGFVAPGMTSFVASVPRKPGPEDNAVDAPAAGEASFDLAMVAGRVVTGHVVEADGRPAEGARVEAFVDDRYGRFSLPGAVAWTAADGSYSLPHLPLDGSFSACAGRDGFVCDQWFMYRGSVSREVLILRPSPRIDGRVRAASGAVLRDLRVEALPSWRSDDGTLRHAIPICADAAGRFAAVAGRNWFRIRATAEGLAPAISRLLVTDPNVAVASVDIVLDEGRTFTGRVTDAATGEPISGTVVRLGEEHVGDSNAHKYVERPPFEPFRRSGTRVVAVTGEDGRFRVPGLFRRPYQVVLEAKDHVRRSVTWDASDPIASAREAAIRMDASASAGAAARPAASIRGCVVDDTGKPVTCMTLRAAPTAIGGTARSGMARSGDDGAFSIDGLDPGVSYLLTMSREGVLRAKVLEVAAGAEGLVVRVVRVADGPASTVSGTVRFPAGTVPSGGVMRLRPVDGADEEQWVQILDNGRFRCPFLLPMAYRVDLQVPGPDTVPMFVDLGVVQPGTKDVVLTVPK
jgi:protocatechuate 3,4-dioxygenase beta subunit